MTSFTVELSAAASWDPVALQLQDEMSLGPPSEAAVRIGDVTDQVFPDHLERFMPTVSQGGVDDVTGAVRFLSEQKDRRAFRVSHAALQLDDVLVNTTGRHPSILIRESHKRVSFSSSFVALRPREISPTLLWALLSSTTGLSALQSLARVGVPVGRPSSTAHQLIADILVDPHLSKERRDVLAAEVPDDVLDLLPASKPTSRWLCMDIAELPTWDHLLELFDPATTAHTDPLEQLARVQQGRAGQKDAGEESADGALPLLTIANITRGHEPDKWITPTDRDLIVDPGDIVVPSHGADMLARVSDRHAVAATGVYVVRPRPETADRVKAHLTSDTARHQLAGLLVGGAIPRLTIATLRHLPIPDEPDPAGVPAIGWRAPLSERLEDILWPTS